MFQLEHYSGFAPPKKLPAETLTTDH